MNRRQFLKLTGAGLACMGFSRPGAAAIPEVDAFPLEAAPGETGLTGREGLQTRVWQYNGHTPGPTIRVRQGDPIRIPFTNRLDQPTTVHWHGLRIENGMDGVPGMTQPLIEPGEQFLYEFTPQDAGTFWYHTHNRSWEQLARGLYGVLIVEEREPIQVDQDLVLVIDDWLLDGEGQIDEERLGSLHAWSHGGRMGNSLTVNGKPHPQFPVKRGERIRLRLVNVANSRIMPLHVRGVTPTVIAIDGQPVTPYKLEEEVFTLAPAQRIDLVLDMTQDPGRRTELEYVSGQKRLVAASLVYDSARVLRDTVLETPVSLPDNPLTEIHDLSTARKFSLPMEGGAMGRMKGAEYEGEWRTIRELIEEKMIWSLNGTAGLPEEPFFRVPRGTTVVIDMENRNRWPHAMHVHGHHFRSLADNDALLPVWRDTVLVDPRENHKIAFVADNPGKWLIHCHMIEHQAGGMTTWFEVV